MPTNKFAVSRRSWTSERRAALILIAIAVSEGSVVLAYLVLNGAAFVRFMGFAPGRLGGAAGWALAAVVTAIFVAASARLSSVRATLLHPTALKALALAAAFAAGILEEVVFRKLLMDALARGGWGAPTQVLASGVLFGAAHAVWGFMGRSVRAAAGAMVATAALGLALALVYVSGGRSLAPCIAAHFAINLLIEPGLVLAACRGEMGRAPVR